MEKKLVIVESPTKVKSISKFLGSDYIVKASMGHVRDLPLKKIGVDIENNFEPHYVVPKKAKPIVSILKKSTSKASAVYLASDPDREGEAIAWHLKKLFTNDNDKKKKFWRVKFNEITRDAVRDAFKHLGRIDEMKVFSQQARRILDRIVGYKISPLLWKKVKGGLSAGRVQSVALRLICEREEEIDAFKPQEYWSIEAKLHPADKPSDEFTAVLEKLDGKKIKINTRASTDEIINRLKKASGYIVQDIRKREKQRRPLPPFITSLMQQAAINRLGFSAIKTMFVAQQLYEGIELADKESIGLITYMRTDSFRISKDAREAVRGYIKNKFGSEYLPEKPPIYKSKRRAQEAHEAIRPTSMERTPDAIKEYLTPDQLKLYTIIWNRFVASQMSNARLSVTTVFISADNALFKTAGTEVVFPGFLSSYGDAKEEKQMKFPRLAKEEKLTLIDILGLQHFTKAPALYTEASIIKVLEENGIGRPSTYAPIVYTIIKRGYVEKEKGRLHPAELGKVVSRILTERFSDIINVEFTAKMEEELDEIERGSVLWTDVLAKFYKPFIKDLEIAQKELKKITIKPTPTDYKCPKCGKPLVIRSGRYGKFLACSGFPACRYTEPLSTDVKCPEPGCDGKLVYRRSRKGRTFYGCSNYPNCKFTTASLRNLKKQQGIEED